eukprot:CAMPEP_0206498232 /NCGR_PEP_ID=MMETSP0324_2-20121206/50824_1 /ASSEMBLY_ACC=CAM_ASM_000836 /TAXON_ID=2866 /ORGANISM="Crypthecodinium cohnii, Strain Seligo" /LENGTH=227 /DNA_ID=CAMNT_0053984285 /DNA_START=229 /DNA_END=908 /DNA_ORIENTATION=-
MRDIIKDLPRGGDEEDHTRHIRSMPFTILAAHHRQEVAMVSENGIVPRNSNQARPNYDIPSWTARKAVSDIAGVLDRRYLDSKEFLTSDEAQALVHHTSARKLLQNHFVLTARACGLERPERYAPDKAKVTACGTNSGRFKAFFGKLIVREAKRLHIPIAKDAYHTLAMILTKEAETRGLALPEILTAELANIQACQFMAFFRNLVFPNRLRASRNSVVLQLRFRTR